MGNTDLRLLFWMTFIFSTASAVLIAVLIAGVYRDTTLGVGQVLLVSLVVLIIGVLTSHFWVMYYQHRELLGWKPNPPRQLYRRGCLWEEMSVREKLYSWRPYRLPRWLRRPFLRPLAWLLGANRGNTRALRYRVVFTRLPEEQT